MHHSSCFGSEAYNTACAKRRESVEMAPVIRSWVIDSDNGIDTVGGWLLRTVSCQ